MVIMIAAASENNVLGKDNQLIWHLPDDFKRFKQLTTGHYILMGRKTFESFPKPLPNRTHIVITRQKNFNLPGCIAVNSIEAALAEIPKDEDAYIIGGGEIYAQSMAWADQIELTRVHAVLEGDAFFPEINLEDWALQSAEFHPTDEKHSFDFTYETFVKKA